MRLEIPDLNAHGDTLLAVVLGALVATLSGVIANQFEAHLRRRERERSAALLFGEVLSTLRVVIETADTTRSHGDPYGPVTRRMLHAARREVDIYDRNREALMDLRNAKLRADLHRVVVRIAMSLDGLLDSLADPTGADALARDRAFAFMLDQVALVPGLVARLGRIAGQNFDHYGQPPDSAAPRR